MSTSLIVRPPLLVLRQGIAAALDASGGPISEAAGRLTSPLAGNAKWVSGTIASLAISGTATVIFDLGLDWQQYGLLQLTVTGTAALSAITERASDDGATDAQDLIASSGVPLVLTLAAAGQAQGVALVAGRYVRVAITNGGTAQGAGAGVRLVALPA